MGDFFKDCKVHIIPLGLGPKRIALFETQIEKYGGTLIHQLDKKSLPQITHIVVEQESVDVTLKELTERFGNKKLQHLKVMRIEWLPQCLKTKSRVEESGYQVSIPELACPRSSSKRAFEEPECSTAKVAKIGDSIDIKQFVCSQASPSKEEGEYRPQCNQKIIQELQKLSEAFKNSGDKWRNFGYMKAIAAIKTYGKEITSYDQAIAIPGLGQGMASKVWELLETGKLRRTEEVCEGEQAKCLEIFTGIWGVGAATAQQWFAQGYRTLEDIRTKVTLTSQQQIGLKHYDDIQERIPREEVTAIVAVVEREAKAMHPELWVEACGSYRRGKTSCGDIDILMSHPTKDLTRSLLGPLVQRLQEIAFITDNLSNMEDSGSHRKYFGLCRLPGEGHRHRRLDLFVIPWGERGPALLHYTGSALFNRSIRLLAQKKGMSLTEHALYGVAIRSGKEKLATGDVLDTPTEEDVFRLMELDYRPPEERDH